MPERTTDVKHDVRMQHRCEARCQNATHAPKAPKRRKKRVIRPAKWNKTALYSVFLEMLYPYTTINTSLLEKTCIAR